MTTSEFFVILGTVYLVPDMSPGYRKMFGIFFVFAAAVIEIVK